MNQHRWVTDGDDTIVCANCDTYRGSVNSSKPCPVPAPVSEAIQLGEWLYVQGSCCTSYCWNCGSASLQLRPDAAMGNTTDEVVCLSCDETQPEE